MERGCGRRPSRSASKTCVIWKCCACCGWRFAHTPRSVLNCCARSFMPSPFSKRPTPRKSPPATAIRSAVPPGDAIAVFPSTARCCRWPGFPLRARFVSRSTRRANRVRRAAGKPRADFAETVARGVGFHRQQFAPLLDDGEFVNQPLEFRDQMRGNENRPAARDRRIDRRR